MSDVENKRVNFTSLLVYDVSRWGQFQDVDESAYYEYGKDSNMHSRRIRIRNLRLRLSRGLAFASERAFGKRSQHEFEEHQIRRSDLLFIHFCEHMIFTGKTAEIAEIAHIP